jgi:hypothetical protein
LWMPAFQANASTSQQIGCHTVHLREVLNLLSSICGHIHIKFLEEPRYIKSDKLAVKVLIAEIFQKNPNPDYKIQLSTLIDILTGPQFGFTLLKAVQMIRWLIDHEGALIPVEDGLVSFLLRRNITEYEERAKRLAEAWCAGGQNAEILTLAILEEEKKTLEKAAILRLEKEELEEAKEKRRQRKEFLHSERRRVRF